MYIYLIQFYWYDDYEIIGLTVGKNKAIEVANQWIKDNTLEGIELYGTVSITTYIVDPLSQIGNESSREIIYQKEPN